MPTKQASKSTKAVAKVDAVTPDSVDDAAIVAARQAVITAGETLDNTERQYDDAVFAATQAFGTALVVLAQKLESHAGRPIAGLSDWSSIRKALCEGKSIPTGKLVIAGRTDSTLQRAVKFALLMPNRDAIAAYDETRAKVLANAAKPRASATAKAVAADDVYASRSIKSLVLWGEARKRGDVNSTTGAVKRAGNRAPSADVTARTERADAALGMAAVVDDATADAATRDDAMSRLVVPGITVGMLHALSAADLLVLAKVATDMGRAKAKAKPAKTPVPPVLETTAPVPDAVVPGPLDGVSPDTLAALAKLVAMATAPTA